MDTLHLGNKFQKGQAISELLVAFTVLIALTMGIVQMGLMYKWKSTFNNATFYAAREGSLHHAYLENMYQKLDEAMTPLYLRSEPSKENYAIALDKVKKMSSQYPLNDSRISRIEVISPTESIFKSFSVKQYSLVTDQEYEDEEDQYKGCAMRKGVRECYAVQIPNDNLSFRDSHAKTVVIDGESVDINLQDANLLKIRTYWCFELIVPFVNKLIYESVNLFTPKDSPHISNCQNLTQANGESGHYFIPISSDTVLRMQSPVRCESDSVFGAGGLGSCKNLEG